MLMDDSVSVLAGPLGTVNHRVSVLAGPLGTVSHRSGLNRRGGGQDERNRYTRAVWWSG